MIVDTHIHVYSDKSARVVEEMTARDVAEENELYSHMTIDGLLSSMKNTGIDIALVSRLCNHSVKGVKWNSLFQKLRLDEERMFRLYGAMG